MERKVKQKTLKTDPGAPVVEEQVTNSAMPEESGIGKTHTPAGENDNLVEEIITGLQEEVIVEFSKINSKAPCPLLDTAMSHINEAIKVLQARQEERKAQGIHGKDDK